jgi:hypothetical protein
MSKSKIIRVVPVPAAEGTATKTRGTAVYVGDERIKCQSLTLIAEAGSGNVWRAIIETTVQLDGEIVAAVQSVAQPSIEVTCIEDQDRKYMDPATGAVTGAGT